MITKSYKWGSIPGTDRIRTPQIRGKHSWISVLCSEEPKDKVYPVCPNNLILVSCTKAFPSFLHLLAPFQLNYDSFQLNYVNFSKRLLWVQAWSRCRRHKGG